jgi:hypothetical protein
MWVLNLVENKKRTATQKKLPTEDMTERCLSDNWDAALCNVEFIDVSPWEKAKKFVIVIDNILSEDECMRLIQLSENAGYEDALVNVGGGQQMKMTDVRNNDRCIIDNACIMGRIWQRIQSVYNEEALLKAPWVRSRSLWAVGLNERMRFLRYDPGTYFQPHFDGCYVRGTELGSNITC